MRETVLFDEGWLFHAGEIERKPPATKLPIYRTAKTDGPRAIKMLEIIKPNEDPIKFTGLLISQALKDYASNQGTKEKRVLKELSKLDLDMKSAKVEPWLRIESFLLRLSSLT